MTGAVRKIIYLANPYGFSAQQRVLLLPPLIAALEALGLEVWEPFERNNQEDPALPGGPIVSARRISVTCGRQTRCSRW